jgi:hypothetical protein
MAKRMPVSLYFGIALLGLGGIILIFTVLF